MEEVLTKTICASFQNMYLMSKPNLIGQLQSSLCAKLGDTSLKIDELKYEQGIPIGLYTIMNCNGIRYETDQENGHKYGLCRILAPNDVVYWFTIVISYNLTTETPKNVSIIYFNHLFHKIFRAEWSNNVSEHEHAQPHWHFHNHKPDFESPLWDPEAVQVFAEEVKEVVNEKYKNIHFAMCSDWHTNEGCVNELKNSNDINVKNWVVSVVDYINRQLFYLHQK